MKIKSAQILIIIFISATIPLRGQPEEKTSKWSAAIGYSPIYYTNYIPLVFDKLDLYLNAVSGRVTYKISDRFSILTGVSTKQKKIDIRYDQFPNAFLIKNFLEFPIQLNYNIHKSSDTFLPYIKLAIVSSSLHSKLFDGPMAWKESEFKLLTDFGIGTNLRISGPLSVICELSTGYTLTYQKYERAYFSGFLGLQYKF